MTFKSGILFLFILAAESLISQTKDSIMIEKFKKSQLNVETPDSIIKSIWDLNNRVWIFEWRATFLYFENGFKKEEIVSNWKDDKWLLDYKIDFDYTGNYLSEQMASYWEDYYEEWIPKSRYTYIYTAFNEKEQEFDFNWSQLQNEWVNDTVKFYEYTSSNELSDIYVNVWSNFINDLENNSWTNFTYNLGNNDKQTYSIWDFDYLIWDSRTLTEFKYDSANHVSEQILKTKDTQIANWLNDSKIEYKYYPDSLLKEEIYWYWDAFLQNWFEDYKISYIYDADSKLINLILYYFDWYYLEWMNRYQTIYNYNNDGQLILSTNYYSNYGQWINQYCYNYFYPGYTSIHNDEPNYTMKLFPNPASKWLRIELREKWTGTTQIQINDLTGKEVYNNLYYVHNSLIEISLPNLANGIYLFHVFIENKLLTRKIFIQNY